MTNNVQMKKMLKLIAEASNLIALEVKKQAGRRALGNDFGKFGKGGDLSKYGDLLAEKVIVKYLSALVKKNYFDKIILVSEETGIREFKKSGIIKTENSIFIILDPIDGSNNLRPWPTSRASVGTSLAIGRLDRLDYLPGLSAIEAGWICDIFYDLNYYATSGAGAYYYANRESKPKKLRMSPMKSLYESTVAVSLDGRGEKLEKVLKKIKPVLINSKCQRHLGSTVVNLSKVMCGEFDAYCSMSGNVKIHDIAAAKLIVEEAGGFFDLKQVRGPKDKFYLKTMINSKKDEYIYGIGFQTIVAGTKQLFNEMQEYLK